ncbi:MAG TPA: RDD family protein [Candidatus Nanoarchaeia archaeon]|nr:RDD family protein [Candidatus Nanoarchaeia archaeon]
MKSVYQFQASPLRRGLAFLVDLVIMNLIVFTPFEGILAQYAKGSWAETLKMTSIPSELLMVMVCMVILAWLYLVLLEFLLRQTVGMMLLGLYVDGQVSFWRVLIRNLFIVPFFPFFLLWLVEPIYLFFRGERWLEHLTHTRTVMFAEYTP